MAARMFSGASRSHVGVHVTLHLWMRNLLGLLLHPLVSLHHHQAPTHGLGRGTCSLQNTSIRMEYYSLAGG